MALKCGLMPKPPRSVVCWFGACFIYAAMRLWPLICIRAVQNKLASPCLQFYKIYLRISEIQAHVVYLYIHQIHSLHSATLFTQSHSHLLLSTQFDRAALDRSNLVLPHPRLEKQSKQMQFLSHLEPRRTLGLWTDPLERKPSLLCNVAVSGVPLCKVLLPVAEGHSAQAHSQGEQRWLCHDGSAHGPQERAKEIAPKQQPSPNLW